MEIDFDPAKVKELRSRLNKNAITKAIYDDNRRYMALYNRTMSKIPPKTFTRMNNELNKALSTYGEKIVAGAKRAYKGTGSFDAVLKNIYDMIGAAVDIVYVRIQKVFGNNSPVHLNNVKKPEDINIYALSTTITLIPQAISRIMCEIAIGNANYTGGMSLGIMALATMRSFMMPIIEEWTKTFLAEHSNFYDISVFSVTFVTCTSLINHTYNDIMKGAVLPLSVISVVMYIFTMSLNLLTQKYAPKMKYWCFVLSSVLHVSLKLSQENNIMKSKTNKKLIAALSNIEYSVSKLYADEGAGQQAGDNAGGNTATKNSPANIGGMPNNNNVKDEEGATKNGTGAAPGMQNNSQDQGWWTSVWNWVNETFDKVKDWTVQTAKSTVGLDTATDEKGNKKIVNGKEVTRLEDTKAKIAESFKKLKAQLDKVWGEAKKYITDQWNNAGIMTKLFFALGMFALMAAIVFLLVKPDMFAEAVKEFNQAITNITTGIQNAFKGGSLMGILKGLINIVLAPFKIIFAALNFLVDSGIGDVIVLCIAFFTIAAGFIYYQVTKKMPWDTGEGGAAAGGKTQSMIANDYEMANYIFGVKSC